MRIALRNGKPASKQDILALEATLKCSLSVPFRRFIEMSDGAELESNSFNIGPTNKSGIDRFIPVADIPRDRALLADLQERQGSRCAGRRGASRNGWSRQWVGQARTTAKRAAVRGGRAFSGRGA